MAPHASDIRIMAEISASESSADSDQDFDPTAEMLVDDFDDEHTLEEEEAMESADSVTNELDDLQREGEMSLNEVLASYGYASRADYEAAVHSKNGVEKNSPPKKPASSTESPESPPVIIKETPAIIEVPTPIIEKKVEIIDVPDTPEVPMGSRPLLRSVHQASESSDTGTDDDYSPDDDWRKTIQVGSDYQAVIPEGLSKYDDAPAYENEDRLLWDPSKLQPHEVDEYLRESQITHSASLAGLHSIPMGNHIRDDEQALFLLLQCGHNKDEALRRRRIQPSHPADTMSLWSEDECRSFETGLKTYGKDFHLIQLNKVRTRSVGELVQFYYLWKKTERHDVFASKNRVEKKKYCLHPGSTDYMDRFLDEQENPLCHRDPSSSPNMNVPIFGDVRKRTPASSPVAIADSSVEPNAQGHNSFLDGTMPQRVRSPMKVQSGNPPSDCSKEYFNGDGHVSSTTSPKEKKVCLNSDHVTSMSDNLPRQLNSELVSSNPPSDVNCLHTNSENSRSLEPIVDSYNSRFESERGDVMSIE